MKVFFPMSVVFLGVLLVGALDLHWEGLGAGGEEGGEGEGLAFGGGEGGAFV